MDAFLKPGLNSENLDLYLIRSGILKHIVKNADHFRGVLLDVGCGQMPYKELLTSSTTNVTNYIGLDISDNPVHKNNPDIVWIDGQIPLDEESVDCVICTEVLEHCPDPEKVIHEMYRVLKPSGHLFFTIPFLWPLHEVPYDEYRYTPFSIERLLKSSGFINLRIEALGGWNASLAQMLGLWVRRSPMSKRKRKLLSKLLLPLYRFLVKSDDVPENFNQSIMITGLAGICNKP